MSTEIAVRSCSPMVLGEVRAQTHRAIQMLSLAARANREARADDSHASLVWDSKHARFLTLPLASANGDYHLGLTLRAVDTPGLWLSLIRGGTREAELCLNGQAQEAVSSWLDAVLLQASLLPASVAALPYQLPVDVASIEHYPTATDPVAWAALIGWFDIAATVLGALAERHSGHKPGVGPIWVWPHHFDIASYEPLDDGTGDLAPGVGIGMSPGDASYDQPYLYVNPWPAPDPAALPTAAVPGHWHTVGFVGAIATAESLLACADVHQSALGFVNEAVALARASVNK